MDNALDGLITFDGRRFEYALRERARDDAPPAIRFCPWCGSLLFRVRAPRDAVPTPTPRKKKGVAKAKRRAK
jgi:hypothetical protein